MDKPIYEIVEQKDEYTDEVTGTVLCRTDPDGKVWFIPEDSANSDFAAYLAWLDEENKESE